MNLGKIELEKTLKIKDNIAFAFIEQTTNYEKVNGCEYCKKLVDRNSDLLKQNEELQAQIKRNEMEFELNKAQILALEQAGYCPLDEKITNRIGGVVVNETLGHRKNCRHKGE